MDRKKVAMRIAIIMGAFCFLMLIYGVCRYIDRKKKENPETETAAEITNAEPTEMNPSKSESYINSNSRIANQYNNSEPEYDENDPYEPLHRKRDEQEDPSANERKGATEATTQDLFNTPQTPQRNPAASYSSNPYRETAQEREERHRRRQEEAIELAERMAEGNNDQSPPDDEVDEEEETEKIEIYHNASSEVISSVDSNWDNGFSSLGNQNNSIVGNDESLYKCMFARDSEISDGARVAIILMEDLKINGIVIPKNTHLMATCQISSRLMLKLSSIEINGRLISLGYEAFDTDGGKGIYCPEVGNTGRTIRNRGSSLVGSGLSRRVGSVASEIVSTGVMLFQNSKGENTITVPSGYQFFIRKIKQE